MKYEHILKLKDQVQHVLENFPATRNSDEQLIHKVCELFPGKDPVRNASAIERCRRSFNQAGYFLPTDEEVAIKRKMNVDEWRAALGYGERKVDRF